MIKLQDMALVLRLTARRLSRKNGAVRKYYTGSDTQLSRLLEHILSRAVRARSFGPELSISAHALQEGIIDYYEGGMPQPAHNYTDEYTTRVSYHLRPRIGKRPTPPLVVQYLRVELS